MRMSVRKRQTSGSMIAGAGGSIVGDPVILATAGYDHQIRLWQAHSGISRCIEADSNLVYVPNIFDAKASAFKAEAHRVYLGPKAPSHVAVGVLAGLP